MPNEPGCSRTAGTCSIALVMAGVASYAVYRGIQKMPVREVEVASDAGRGRREGAPRGSARRARRREAWPRGPRRARSPGAFAKAEDVVGRGLLAAGARERTDHDGEARAAGSRAPAWRRRFPSGMRAISVKVNEVIGVAGFVVPGAHVDVLATVDVKDETTTRTVVSNLQVLAAGTRYDQQEAQGRQADSDDRRDAAGDARGRRAGGAGGDEAASCCSSCATRWTSRRRRRQACAWRR